MYLEPLPIEHFVTDRYRAPAVQRIVETWNVEPEKVVDLVTRHFRDMGILKVFPVNEKAIFRSMIIYLRHAPEIQTLVHRARREEVMRRRSRHAE